MTHRGQLGLSGALVLSCWAARATLDGTMWLQMLVQAPILVVAGVLAARDVPPARSWLRAWNAHGIAGLTLAAGGVMLWMIPRLLDAAVEHPSVDALKYATLVASGAIGAVSWRAAGVVVRVFLFGNATWMTATIGLLLLDSASRLCANYTMNDQQYAGYGLLVVTLTAVIFALVRGTTTVASQ